MVYLETAMNEELKIKQMYKSVFLTEQGKVVLEDMLWDLKFLSPCNDEGDMALNNYAKVLLSTIYGEIPSETLRGYIKRLLKRKSQND